MGDESPRARLLDPSFGGRYAGGFVLAAWGFLFLLDLYFGVNGRNVDLLPDLAGALLFAAAAARLGGLHAWARPALGVAVTLVPVGAASLLSDLSVFESQAAARAIEAAGAALGVALVWLLGGIVVDVARAAGDASTELRARLRRGLFAAYVAASWGVLAFGLRAVGPEGRDAEGVFLVVGLEWLVIGIALLVLQIGLMRRASRLVTRSPGEPAAARVGTPAVVARGLGIGALAVVLLAAGVPAGWLAFSDGGAQPRALPGGAIEYGPEIERWVLLSAGADEGVLCENGRPCPPAFPRDTSCALNARVLLSSGTENWMYRRDLRASVYAVSWSGDGRTLPDGAINIASAGTSFDLPPLGWWWRAAGERVDVGVPVACDAWRVNLTINLASGRDPGDSPALPEQEFASSQTAKIDLRAAPANAPV